MRGMPERLHYFAVRYIMNADRIEQGLVAIDGKTDKVYWGGAPSHCMRADFKMFEIERDYGWDDEWPEDFHIGKQYVLDYPPQPYDVEAGEWPIERLEGELSPDGVFYRCEYMGHSSLCADLLIVMGVDLDVNFEDTLLAQGFATIRYGHIISDDTPTEAQVKWLKRAVELGSDRFRDKVTQYLDLYSDVVALITPDNVRSADARRKL